MPAPHLRSLLLLSLCILASGLASACAIDHTGKSASFLMTRRLDNTHARARDLEKDLARERGRIDAMKHKATDARKRIAESGATLESFLEELTRVRGELSGLTQSLGESARFREDLDLRITDLEVRLAQLHKVLQDSELIASPADAIADQAAATVSTEPGAPAGGDQKPTDEATADQSASAPAGSDIVIEPDTPAQDEVAMQRIRHFVEGSEWKKAGSLLQEFLEDHAESPLRFEALYLLGECLFGVGKFKTAIGQYDAVVKGDPQGEWALRAMLKQALSVEKSGKVKIARALLEDLIEKHPKSPEAATAAKRLEQMSSD